MSILRAVAAIDAPSGEVDDNICAVDFTLPRTERRAVPLNDASWTHLRLPAEDHNIMTISVKGARQDGTNLS